MFCANIEFDSLDLFSFDTLNPEPITETPQSQYIQVQSEILVASAEVGDTTPEMQHGESSHNADESEQIPVSSQIQPSASSSSQTQQTVIDSNIATTSTPIFTIGAAPSVTSSQKRARRCAICVSANCARRAECKGSGSRKLCLCNHPQVAKGKKVRLSEKQLAKRS